MGLKGLRVNKWLKESVETIHQGEHPKITASNLVLSKSVRRLLALLVVCDFLMNADRNGTWAQSEHVVDCARNFSRGNLQYNLGHGRNRSSQGFAFKRHTCDVVGTHTTFLCIPSDGVVRHKIEITLIVCLFRNNSWIVREPNNNDNIDH